MSLILSSVYLGNIDYYTILNQNSEIRIDVCEHFQKQSYRNRSVIHGANGALNLIIPLVKRGIRTKMEDIKIDNKKVNEQLLTIIDAFNGSDFKNLNKNRRLINEVLKVYAG